jgi:hypothetical protein
MALARQINGEHTRVLPVLFEDCEIPGFLIEKAYADFRGDDKFDSAIAELVSAIGKRESRSFKDRIFGRLKRP